MQIEIDLTEEQEAKLLPYFEICKELFIASHGGRRAMLVAQVLARDNFPSAPREHAFIRVGFLPYDKAKPFENTAGFDPRPAQSEEAKP